ncbi:hypothetical protein LguiA_022902 [Lonicera macranthoides]
MTNNDRRLEAMMVELGRSLRTKHEKERERERERERRGKVKADEERWKEEMKMAAVWESLRGMRKRG